MTKRKRKLAPPPEMPSAIPLDEPPKRNLNARNAIDESLSKIKGVLSLITSFAKEEQFEDVSNACWMISDEIERLDEKLADLNC